MKNKNEVGYQQTVQQPFVCIYKQYKKVLQETQWDQKKVNIKLNIQLKILEIRAYAVGKNGIIFKDPLNDRVPRDNGDNGEQPDMKTLQKYK